MTQSKYFSFEYVFYPIFVAFEGFGYLADLSGGTEFIRVEHFQTVSIRKTEGFQTLFAIISEESPDD